MGRKAFAGIDHAQLAVPVGGRPTARVCTPQPALGVAMKKQVATEAQEQTAVISWWQYACRQYGVPECSLLHIANEGTGSAARGRLQKRQGVRRALPICSSPCLVARFPGSGLR